MNFVYQPPNTTGGITLGTSAPAGGAATGGLTFGTPTASSAATTAPGGVTFGTNIQKNLTGFNVVSTNPPAATTGQYPIPFNVPSSTTGFSLPGAAVKPAATAVATPTFGLPKQTTPNATSVSLPASSTVTSGFSLGTPAAASTAAFTLGTTTASTGFALGASAASTGFALGTTTASTGFTLGTTTASTGFTLGATTTTTGFPLGSATPSTGFSLSTATTTKPATIGVSAAPVATTSTPGITLPVTTNAAAKPAAPTPPVSFAQLEENINKWTIELEEQEKVFMNQVAHINEWDRLLLANGEKIVSLNNSVDKVKLEQQQLDHELDFIVAQQRELEECLLPLEKEFSDITVSDPERDRTYRMAENLNTQLKQMSEDLKEVIEHINEKNKNQDTSDPIVQIGRILNAHMNSLQWVDQNTALMKQQLDQVTKLSEVHRRENDSTQNL